jgi:hypothetical protein
MVSKIAPEREVTVYEAKTKPTAASVDAYIDAIENEQRRADCRSLITLMKAATGCEPILWGPSIVGFGSYHYKYASGHEGDACLAGFSSRKGDLSIYILAGSEEAERLLAKLGKHKMGKACLYVKRLADIDTEVLGRLVKGSVAEVRRRYPATPQGGA